MKKIKEVPSGTATALTMAVNSSRSAGEIVMQEYKQVAVILIAAITIWSGTMILVFGSATQFSSYIERYRYAGRANARKQNKQAG